MAEPFNFELILMDFLKYMPEAKRHDYELMLRRCNFSDPADPMFPVMLFLLFFQDNLADRMEELTEEVKTQKTIPPTDHAAAAPERKSCWKIVVAVLMAVQLMLTVFGVLRFRTIALDSPWLLPFLLCMPVAMVLISLLWFRWIEKPVFEAIANRGNARGRITEQPALRIK